MFIIIIIIIIIIKSIYNGWRLDVQVFNVICVPVKTVY